MYWNVFYLGEVSMSEAIKDWTVFLHKVYVEAPTPSMVVSGGEALPGH